MTSGEPRPISGRMMPAKVVVIACTIGAVWCLIQAWRSATRGRP